MAAADPKKVLTRENELLKNLMTAAKKFQDDSLGAGETLVAAFAQHWQDYFEGWRARNEDLINNDANRDQELKNEIKRLKKFSESLQGDNSPAAAFYRDKVFAPDTQDAEALVSGT